MSGTVTVAVNSELVSGEPVSAELENDLALDSGAILPEGTALMERRDSASTHSYQHPALTGRTVVRLTADALGAAEDLTMEFLGFAAAAEPVRVGVLRQQALGFPAWALIHDPANGHHALNLVKDIEKLSRQAVTKPGFARDGFDQLADQLAGAVPHFLPTFYEQAARAFLAAENTAMAASCFGKARAAERAHGLAIDEEAQGASFLEFALAGALTAKALTEYARALAARVSPDVAYTQFRRICLERVASGLPPYTAMSADLRRLAKAAGRDTVAEDAAFASELLALPSTAKAPAGFWNAYRAPLVRAAKADAQVRGLLLSLLPTMPGEGRDAADSMWLDLLHETGAVSGLTDPLADLPAEALPADGASGWLNRFAKHNNRGQSWRYRSNERDNSKLLDLVERMAPRLLAEQAPLVLCDEHVCDIDLLDLCLTLGKEVSDPVENFSIRLDAWLAGTAERRDLTALAADSRIRPHLYNAVDKLAREASGEHNESSNLAVAAERVTAVSGLRSVLGDWLADQAETLAGGGLVDLDEGLQLMNCVADPRILAVNPEAARRMTELDIAPFLGDALRAGIFDEYGWPALEEACARLAGADPGSDPERPKKAARRNQRSPFTGYDRGGPPWTLTEQWPYLLLQQEARVEVLDAEGTRLEHTVSFPANQNVGNIYGVIFRYADDQLLVVWHGYPDSGGYWTGDPTRILESERHHDANSLELPWGGRTFGGRPLTAGSTNWSTEGKVISDGTDYWVLVRENKTMQWTEFDPRTGTRGRVSMPEFFSKPIAAQGTWKLRYVLSSLRPATAGMRTSPLGESGGLVGFRTFEAPDGTQICESIDGGRVTIRALHDVPAVDGSPRVIRFGNPRHNKDAVGAMDFPGARQRQAVLRSDGLQLVADGCKRTASLLPGRQSPDYARGTWCVPPLLFWHYLTVRDAEGSAALRDLTDESARYLLDQSAGLKHGPVSELVGELLPKVSNTRLRSGIAGYVRVAGKCVKQLAELRGRFERIGEIAVEAAPAHEGTLLWDETFRAACDGVCPASHFQYQDVPTPQEAVRILAELLVPAQPPTEQMLARLKSGVYPMSSVWLATVQTGFALPALAFRAAAPATGDAERAALLDFLPLWEASGLSAPGAQVRLVTVRLMKNPKKITGMDGTVVDTGHGRLLVLYQTGSEPNGDVGWCAVEYSRDGQFTGIPGWTITAEWRAVPWPGPEWTAQGAIGEFCRRVRADGPAPMRPEQAGELSENTGLSRAEARVLLAGLPTEATFRREQVSAEVLEVLESSPAATKIAAKRFAHLDVWLKSGLVAGLLPESVDALWQSGPRLDVATASLITAFGKQRPLPEWLIPAAEKASSATIVQGLLSPEGTSWLGGVVTANSQTGEVGRRYNFGGGHIDDATVGLLWLSYHLPVGDPLREPLPQALTLIRERLTDPQLKVQVGHTSTAPALIAALGHEPVKSEDGWRVGPLWLNEKYTDWCHVLVYPADLSGPDDPALILLEQDSDYRYLWPQITSLRLLLGAQLSALLQHGQAQPGLDPYPAQDPTRSVPELVTEAAGKLGLSQDAAALYLMLLALPDPTDRNQADWTGWKPARLKAARTELAGAKSAEGDLVVSGTRARAGRSLFLPGAWHALKSPHLPLEAWKGALLGVQPNGTVSLGLIIPRIPVADLYAAAWQRVQNGDGPRYNELTTGKKK